VSALVIQETMQAFAKELTREHGVDVRVRTGLNTGSVVVGRIGDDLRMDYTAIGDTTHLAFRLQGLAPPDAVVIRNDAPSGARSLPHRIAWLADGEGP
jgi:class 3 adenylate cyclase